MTPQHNDDTQGDESRTGRDVSEWRPLPFWKRMFHQHVWGDLRCAFLGPRHAHARWCLTCGDYKMVYGIACYERPPIPPKSTQGDDNGSI